MEATVYRIRTDGKRYICELQRHGSWKRVCFQNGHVLSVNLETASMGEFFETEKELLKTIESVIGTSARRVREWRTV